MDEEGHVFGRRAHEQRTYVEVVSRTTADGLTIPMEVRWEDGRRFRISRILGTRDARTLKQAHAQGLQGFRYTVLIGRSQAYLWYDSARNAYWVEAKRRPGMEEVT